MLPFDILENGFSLVTRKGCLALNIIIEVQVDLIWLILPVLDYFKLFSSSTVMISVIHNQDDCY